MPLFLFITRWTGRERGKSLEWQEAYRREFPAVKQCVYLDTAYDCGGSEIGRRAAQRYFDDWARAAVDNERGGPGRETFFRLLDETRGMVGRLLGGVEAEQVAFVRNTNEGINALLQGFVFQPGDNIVTDALEHESVLMPALNAARLRGVECRVAGSRELAGVTPEQLMERCDGRTRMVLVSHIQSSTGYRIDLEALGAFCRGRGIFLVADAIQSLGQVPFRAREWQVDAVAAAGYKGLAAVNSVGFLYASPGLLRQVWPVYAAAGSCLEVEWRKGVPALACSDPGSARKLENSSLDNLGIYVLHDALDRLLDIGVPRIWAHIGGLYDRLYAGLRAEGFRIVTPGEPERHGGVLSLRVEELERAFQHFRAHNIALSISAGRYLRLSIGAYTNQTDIDAALQAAARCPVR